jgi:hypothetical protein
MHAETTVSSPLISSSKPLFGEDAAYDQGCVKAGWFIVQPLAAGGSNTAANGYAGIGSRRQGIR